MFSQLAKAIMSFSIEHLSLPQMSRDAMRGLKAQTDEKIRIRDVNRIVTNIYNSTVNSAKTNESTCYKFTIQHNATAKPNEQYTFYKTNMTHILQALQAVFPDCLVEHRRVVCGRDGKLHDVPNMDEAALSFILGLPIQEAIVIEWS